MEQNWNVRGLILEGVCGTGKSTVLRALLCAERYLLRDSLSCLVLSEHQTQRVLERKEREMGLVPADNIALLETHVGYLEGLHQRLSDMPWCAAGRTNMRLTYVLERFHLTHVCHYPHIDWGHVEETDRRLAQLDGKLCLLTADEATLEQRVITGRGEEWRRFLERHGQTPAEIVAHYAAQQDMLRELCARSALETQVVDTSASTIEDTRDAVLGFWGIGS